MTVPSNSRGKARGRSYQLAVTLYVFRWNRPGLPGRKGQLCKVNRRGKMNSCEIEFLDGTKAIVSRNAIMKYRGEGHES